MTDVRLGAGVMAQAARERRPAFRVEPGTRSLLAEVRELVRSRDLLTLLVLRDLQVRYRQTLLGVVWVVLQPLVPAVILAAILGAFAGLPSDGVPYLAFTLGGFTVWGLFAGSLTRAARSFLADAPLIGRVYFPRSVLPIAAGLSNVVDFGVAAGVTLVIVSALGYGPDARWIVLPLASAAALILALALGLGFAATSAFYRDFAHALPFVVQVLFYLSPVAYSSALVPPRLVWIYDLNPMVGIVESFRWGLFGATPFPTDAVLVGLASGTAMAVISVVVFGRIEHRLADVI